MVSPIYKVEKLGPSYDAHMVAINLQQKIDKLSSTYNKFKLISVMDAPSVDVYSDSLSTIHHVIIVYSYEEDN